MTTSLTPTPRLVAVGKDIEANIAAMARYAAGRGKALRPHAKTHKSPDIAKLQIAAGAIGISGATVAEIEALAKAGLPGLLLTSPIAADKVARIARLHADGADVRAVVDSEAAVAAFAAAIQGARQPLRLLVDIDIGHHRTGTQSPDATLAVARAISGNRALAFAGVQAYAGHVQHVTAADERRRIVEACAARLRANLDALRAAGFSPAIVSGAGTGSFITDMDLGLYTEFQVGSYVVMDTEYHAIEPAKEAPRFATALFVESTVICGQFGEFVLVDAGHKALFRGGPHPVLAGAAAKHLRYEFAGDEHGRLYGAAEHLPKPGERVRFELPHCDPNVVLFDHIDVEDGGALVAQWPVTGRGVW